MKLVFRVHAVQRMFERRISVQDVEDVLASGEVIEDYPHDFPFASQLHLGFVGDRSVHVVSARNPNSDERIIITVYEPDLHEWEPGFRKRKT